MYIFVNTNIFIAQGYIIKIIYENWENNRRGRLGLGVEAAIQELNLWTEYVNYFNFLISKISFSMNPLKSQEISPTKS